MEFLYAFAAIFISSIVWLYLWARKKAKYYEERGIPHEKPYLLLGNSLDMILKGKTQSELVKNLCETKFKNEPVFGFYDFVKPSLVVKDIDLVHRVLIKDFQHFVDHGFEIDVKKNPYESSLFNMAGNRWRAFRHKFSPMFTSGKLKNMSGQMTALSENMIELIKSRDLKMIDLREISAQLSMDVIGSCGYGIDGNNLGNEDSEYRKMAKKIFKMSVWRYTKMMLMLAFPNFIKKLGIQFTQPDVLAYFKGIVEETIDHRMKNSYQRNDFVQLMLTLKEKGSIEVTSRDASDDFLNLDSLDNYSTEKFDLSYPEIVGHAIGFLTTGFEPSALTLLYLCYDLSVNQKSQEKLRDEIKRIASEHEGKITHEAVKNMPYLTMCLNESLRMHTLVPELFRVCTKEYTFPGTNITVKPGDSVKIPVPTFHMNAELYPEPEKYDPDRFQEGINRPPCSFLPFGDGPRMCIAMRFVLLEVKLAAAHLFYNFKMSLSPKTKPLEYGPYNFLLTPKHTLYFDFEKC